MSLTNLAFSNKLNSRLGQLLSGVYFNGFNSTFTLGDIEPTLYLDFEQQVYACRGLDGQDYTLGNTEPTLVLDFSNNTFGA